MLVDYLMLHLLAGATIQVANLSIIYDVLKRMATRGWQQEGGNQADDNTVS